MLESSYTEWLQDTNKKIRKKMDLSFAKVNAGCHILIPAFTLTNPFYCIYSGKFFS